MTDSERLRALATEIREGVELAHGHGPLGVSPGLMETVLKETLSDAKFLTDLADRLEAMETSAP